MHIARFRNIKLMLALPLLITASGCGDDGAGDEVGNGETVGDGDATGDGDGDGDAAGDGDGDGDAAGDGDGDATGDGDGDGDGDATGDGDGEPAPEVDEQAILAAIADYQNTFVLINAEPFVSGAHMGGGIMVNVWAHPDHADQYKAIDPMNPMATTFPEGAIILKEHFDDQMNVAGGTVMYKGPPGYNPDHNDWWFGVGDLLGGTLANSGPDLPCVGCHTDVSETDYLYGVPPADQNP